jgi:hypothetical protein
MRFGATECRSSSFFFPSPVVPRCFNTYSFFSCFTSSHVEIPRAGGGPNDGRAALFDLICVSASPCRPLAISSVPGMPSSLFPSTLSIFVPTSLPHPAISCSPLFSCRSSCLRVRCLLRKTLFRLFPCLDFSEFKDFESSPTSKIRPGICPSILSPL